MTLIFFGAAGANDTAGLFIPRASLPGLLTDAELAAGEPANVKLSKFTAAALFRMHNFLVATRSATTNPLRLFTGLGIDVNKSAPAGTGANRFTQTFTCVYAQVIDNQEQEIYPIPVPSTGENEDRGQMPIASVFSNTQVLTANDDAPSAGVLIPHAVISQYGADVNTDPVNDVQSRKWIPALFRMLFDLVPVRNPGQSVQSGVTAKIQTPVVNATLPANATTAPNPTTGLFAGDLFKLDVYSRNIAFTIEYEINEIDQTYDVRIA